MGGDAPNVIHGGVYVPSLPIPYIYGDLEGISRLEALPSSDEGYRSTPTGFCGSARRIGGQDAGGACRGELKIVLEMLDVDTVPADVI